MPILALQATLVGADLAHRAADAGAGAAEASAPAAPA